MNFEEAMNSLEGVVINLDELPFTTFEVWFEDQEFYANMRFIHGDKLFDKDGGAYRVLPVQMTYQAWKVGRAAIKEMDEVIKMQDADLRKYEKQIESLKTQLAVYKEDMQKDAEKIAYEQMQASSWKAEYSKMVAERDELQSKSQCIKNLVEQRNLAENMLRKISVAAQKKLPTFGAALRFNDEVKEILRGES